MIIIFALVGPFVAMLITAITILYLIIHIINI